MAQRTPLHDRHLALGATMVEFGGYDMPLQYRGIREEHVAVRQRAGLFDLSHMGEVLVSGPGSEAALQRLVANDVHRLTHPGRALYAVMCNDMGGIVDDVIVYRGLFGAEYLVVVNAGTRHTDVAWMVDHVGDDVLLDDASDEIALIAVQGPRALEIVQRLADVPLEQLRPFRAQDVQLAGLITERSVVSRTGYTGEDGVEIYIDAAAAGPLWDALLDAGGVDGLLPCGLGARDTLRLEAGLRLYGQDMDDRTDPFSAALAWTVKLDKGDFIGAAALRRLAERGTERRLVGLRLAGRAIARHGMPVLDRDRPVGEVTSGTHSFTLGCGVATAYVETAMADRGPGSELHVDVRGRLVPAAVVSLPFYRRPAGC